MTLRLVAGALLGASLMSAPAFAESPTFRIENAAARVVVIPEARNDVAFSVQRGRADMPEFKQHKDGGVTVIDGGLKGGGKHLFGLRNGLSCKGSGEHVFIEVPDRGDIALQDLPLITIRTPMDVRLSVGEAVFGQIGPSQSVELANSGCGDWRIADVRGAAHFALSGSGDVRAQGTGEAVVHISGSSDVYLGAVNGGLEAKVSGSGDVRVASINGPLSAKIAGSGDVVVNGGQSPNVIAAIAGSGDITFRGTAGALNASIAGSGDVNVARVTGPITKHIAGSGDVKAKP